jgi:integrase
MTDKKAFTVKSILALGDGKHADPGCRGLYLWVRGASRSWQHRYTYKGRPDTITIGSLRHVGLAAARDQVAKHRAVLIEGGDPKKAKVVEEVATRTFADDAAAFYETMHWGWSAGHASNWQSQMDRYILPALGEMPTKEITPSDVVNAISPIWGKLTIAPTLLVFVGAVFDHALNASDNEDRDFPRGNPVTRAKGRMARNVQPSVSPHGSVPWQHAPTLFTKLRDENSTATDALCFLLAVGTPRVSEIVSAKWDDIHEMPFEQGKALFVSGERIKGRMERKKKGRYIPLPDAALDLLKTLRGRNPASQYLFPSRVRVRGDQPLHHDTLTLALQTVWPGVDPKTGRKFDVHGLRASFRTWTQENGQNRDAAELCLDHDIHQSKTEGAYARADMLEQRRELCSKWCAYLMGSSATVAEAAD